LVDGFDCYSDETLDFVLVEQEKSVIDDQWCKHGLHFERG
jgi:hypothetical protein